MVDAEIRAQVRCWRYEPENGRAIAPRAEPNVNAAKHKKLLQPGAVFRVCREQQGADGILYLQLADGAGWLFDRKPEVGAMCFRVKEDELDEKLDVQVMNARPSKPPGAYWKLYKCSALGSEELWWYYEGPLGKWWCDDADKDLEPYIEDDADKPDTGVSGSIDPPVEGPRKKLRSETSVEERCSAEGGAPEDGLRQLMRCESLRCDRDAVLAAVRSNGLAVAYADAKLQRDREVALAAVSQDGSALQFLPADLQADREVVMAAVQKHGSVLQFATEELRDDAEVVLSAVSNYGKALQMASTRLRGHRDIVLSAVRHCGWALKFAALELRKDQEIVSTAIRHKAAAFASRRRSQAS